jgi:hypothetical protein
MFVGASLLLPNEPNAFRLEVEAPEPHSRDFDINLILGYGGTSALVVQQRQEEEG